MRLDVLLESMQGIPRLAGARCVGKWHAFDNTDDPDTIEYCINICTTCPALGECRAWLQGLPLNKRPTGVVAATLLPDKKGKAA